MDQSQLTSPAYLMHVKSFQPGQGFENEEAVPGLVRKRISGEVQVPQMAQKLEHVQASLQNRTAENRHRVN